MPGVPRSIWPRNPSTASRTACCDRAGYRAYADTIVTENSETAAAFTQRVQSSCTLVNASTRFNDGFQLGMGAEIGISTSRVHAYGPMGLEELTSQRFVVEGAGHVR